MAVHRAGTMAHRGAACVPALDDAGVALTLGDTGYVNAIALSEHVSLDHVANLEHGAILKAELLEVLLHRVAGLLQVAELRLVELLLLDVCKAHLNGVIAFLLLGLELGHDAGTCLDDGDRDDLALSVEDLGHANLLADDCFLHTFFLLKGYWLTGGTANLTPPREVAAR